MLREQTEITQFFASWRLKVIKAVREAVLTSRKLRSLLMEHLPIVKENIEAGVANALKARGSWSYSRLNSTTP